MNGKIALALVSILGATTALPAMSTSALAVERHDDHSGFDADSVLRRLQDRGVDATSVEQWNGLIRAYVTIDGRQVMQFFDADTLAPTRI